MRANRKKGNHLVYTTETWKDKTKATFSLNTVTCCACDMATPWPPPTSGPEEGPSKKVLEAPKN